MLRCLMAATRAIYTWVKQSLYSRWPKELTSNSDSRNCHSNYHSNRRSNARSNTGRNRRQSTADSCFDGGRDDQRTLQAERWQ